MAFGDRKGFQVSDGTPTGAAGIAGEANWREAGDQFERRSIYLSKAETGFDADPNSGSPPASITGASTGTWFREETAGKFWRKTESVWEDETPGVTPAIQDEGTALGGSPHTIIDYVGAGVTVTDKGGGKAEVNIPGGGFFSDGTGTDAAIGKGSTAPTAAGDNSLAHGNNCRVTATADRSLALGASCTVQNVNSIALGSGCTTGASAPNAVAMGSQCVIGSPNTFAQGDTCTIGTGSDNAMVQGKNNSIAINADDSIAQGRDHQILNNAQQSSAFGRGCLIDGARGFAHGFGVGTKNQDQKAWGSNRNTGAKFSHTTRHVTTTDDTPTTLHPHFLEPDHTYVIWAHVVARNTTTNGESASFLLQQATVYRDPTGGAVFIGSPTFVKESTGQDPGPGNAAFTVDIIVNPGNTSQILIRVKGEPAGEGQTYQWCGTLMLTEVRG